MPAHEPTLSEVLYGLGWGHQPAPNGRRRLVDADGVLVGDYAAGEAWQMLRDRGLYTEGK